MTTTPESNPSTIETGYVGAHRWTLTWERSWKWRCRCGSTGNIATRKENLPFVFEQFAHHAHDAIVDAALALLLRRVKPELFELLHSDRVTQDAKNLEILLSNQIKHYEDAGIV